MSKRARAAELGADHVLDPSQDNIVDEIREISGGEGAAVAIDFVGVDASMALGASSLGRQGLFVLVGLAGGSFPFSFFSLAAESGLTTSNWGTRNELEEVLAMVRSNRLVSTIEQRPLNDINDVFARLAAGQVEGRALLIP